MRLWTNKQALFVSYSHIYTKRSRSCKTASLHLTAPVSEHQARPKVRYSVVHPPGFDPLQGIVVLRRLNDEALDLGLWVRSFQVRSTRIRIFMVPFRTGFSHSRNGINDRASELGASL